MICFCFFIDSIYRLTLLRWIIGTILIRFELYHYTHSKKSCCDLVIILLYSLLSIICIPFIFLLFTNELIIAMFMKCFKCICRNNTNLSTNTTKTTKPDATAIRIMSYNTQSGVGMDGELNFDRIKSVVKDNNVDILCMQEAEWESERYPGNQNDDIADFCNLQYTKNIVTRAQYAMLGNGFYGITIATKYPILDEKLCEYPHWIGRNLRKAIAVKLDVSAIYSHTRRETTGNPFIWMICTHFQNDLTFDEKLPIYLHFFWAYKYKYNVFIRSWYQARLLLDFCKDIVNNETNDNNFRGLVIAGDLNLPPFASPIQYLSAKLIQCVDGDTWPANNPKTQIDHIFLHYSSRLCKDDKLCHVVDNDFASDHRPIIAVLYDSCIGLIE